MRVNDLEAPEDFLVYRQVKAEVFMHRCLLFDSPVLNRAGILFHHDVITRLIDSIVVKIGHTWFKPKLLEAGYF